MNLEDHKARHVELHQKFDELLADFIGHTGWLPSKTTLMDFMHWSHGQTTNPTPGQGDDHGPTNEDPGKFESPAQLLKRTRGKKKSHD